MATKTHLRPHAMTGAWCRARVGATRMTFDARECDCRTCLEVAVEYHDEQLGAAAARLTAMEATP